MIRPFTCVCVLLAAGSGLYLYQTKHRSQMLDREIARTIKQTEVVRERTGVLRGEWALLSEPDRLAELSRQHLGLKTLQPQQFVAVGDLASRLPAPLPPGSMMAPTEEIVDLPPLAAAKLQQPPQMAAAAVPAPAPASGPAPAPAKPVQVAAAQAPAAVPSLATPPAPVAVPPVPAPRPAVKVAAARPTEPAAAPVVQVAAAPVGGARVQTASAGNGSGNMIGESVARVARGLPPLAYRSEGSGGLTATPIAATPIGTMPQGRSAMLGAPVISAPMVSAPVMSALGGARTALPAPVPYSAQR